MSRQAKKVVIWVDTSSIAASYSLCSGETDAGTFVIGSIMGGDIAGNLSAIIVGNNELKEYFSEEKQVVGGM